MHFGHHKTKDAHTGSIKPVPPMAEAEKFSIHKTLLRLWILVLLNGQRKGK